MSIIFDVIGGLVNVGMQAYKASQANEAEALRMLQEALAQSAEKVSTALAALDAARRAADEKIAAAFDGDK